MITDKAIYNLLPSNFGTCKRRIGLETIQNITISQVSDEFVLHCPEEYDYRLMSLRKREVVDCIKRNCEACTGFSLNIELSQQIVLKDLCMTKKDMKRLRKAGQIPSFKRDPVQKADAKGGASGGEFETTGWARDQTDVTVDSFELLKVIGRGSFGKVMQVRKHDNKKIYAMKILRKEAIIQRNQVEHTRAERQILEEIDHPFLMKLHYGFQTPTKLYLVMDMITGGELFFHLKVSPHSLPHNQIRTPGASLCTFLEKESAI